MAEINLDDILAQRAEATGSEEGRAPFTFTARAGEHKGEPMTFTIRDSMFFEDEDWDEIQEIREDDDAVLSDIAEFWMGEDEWDRFVDAGGTSRMIVAIVQEKASREQETDSEGKSGRPSNRSSRRAAARKRQKQR